MRPTGRSPPGADVLMPEHLSENVRRHAGNVVGDPGAILASAAAEDLAEHPTEIRRAALELLPLGLQLGADVGRGRAGLPLPPAEVRHDERREHHHQLADLLAVESRRAPDALLNGLTLSAEDMSEDARAIERARHRDVGGAAPLPEE